MIVIMGKTNNKILVCMVLLVFGGSLHADAQRWFRTSSLEFGLMGGMSHYSGDLTQSFFEGKGFKPSVGIITRYSPGEVVTFRLSAQYGALEGRDDWYEDQEDPNRRNLSFRSSLWDFTGAIEVNLRRMEARQKSGVYPYLFTGASVFRFNPEAQFVYDRSSGIAAYMEQNAPGSYTSLQDRDGEWIELQPLATEGQETTEFNDRKRYALTQIAIPLGGGLKFKLNHNWTLGVEYGVRFTFTDYIDDVSTTYVDPVRLNAQYGGMSSALSVRSPEFIPASLEGSTRGDPNNNDIYGLLGISLTYRLYGNRPNCPSF
jgi:opacity protein-like surface antigen